MSIEHSVSTLIAAREQRRVAHGAILLLICTGLLLRFAGAQAPGPGPYILMADTALGVVALIVAVLLYGIYKVSRPSSLLLLYAGFLFVSLATLAQALPDSTSGTDDSPLQLLCGVALPLSAIVYAVMRRREQDPAGDSASRLPTLRSAAVAIFVAAVLYWLLSAGNAPSFASGSLLALSAAATGIIWARRHSLLDLWLFVALVGWTFSSLLPDIDSARLCGLLGVSCLLLVLLQSRAREPEVRKLGAEATVRAVSNELNQPLFAISINAEAISRMLEAQPPDHAEIRAALADITEDTLRISRTMATAQRLLASAHEAPANIDVAQLVNECVSYLQTEMFAQRVSCEVATAPHLPEVRGVRKQLLQMLLNLVTNSLEAMSAESARERRLRVVASRLDARAVEILIEDSGTGIPPEDAARVFEPFYTTKPHRTGLGLAICRSIADAHGGKISVAPGEGRGVAFRVILPASS